MTFAFHLTTSHDLLSPPAQFCFAFMAVVWAVWWFVCVRKCSRNLKALPYLSTRYRQVVPAKKAVVLLRRLVLLSSAFRSHLLLKIGCTNNKSHFDSSAAVLLFLRVAQPMARAVHALPLKYQPVVRIVLIWSTGT